MGVFGSGLFKSNYICNRLGLKTNFNLNNLNDLSFKQLIYFSNNNYNLDNYLNNKSKANIKFKINLGTYESNRHRLGYPVRAQRSLYYGKSQKRLHKFRLYFKVNKYYFYYSYLVFDKLKGITQHWLISNCDNNLENFYFLYKKKNDENILFIK